MSTYRAAALGTALAAAALVPWAAPPAQAQDAPPPAADGEPAAAAAEPPVPAESVVREGVPGWVRTKEHDASGVVLLELASRAYHPAEGTRGPVVHLVAAVHVADASFYEARQRELDALDLVLFEGVRPPGASPLPADADAGARAEATRHRLDLLLAIAETHRKDRGAYPADRAALEAGADRRLRHLLPTLLVDGWGRPVEVARRPAGEGDGAPAESVTLASVGPDGKPDGTDGGDDLRVSAEAGKAPPPPAGFELYPELAAALGLVDQVSVMDTSRRGWRNCDMGMEELAAATGNAGGDLTGLLAMLQGTGAMGKAVKGFAAMIGKNPRLAFGLKSQMVVALGSDPFSRIDELSNDPQVSGLFGNLGALMKVILEGRNDVVLRDLRGVLEREPGVRTVAVFYGAGHMTDLARRITEEMGYRAGEERWTLAMRLDPADAGMTPEQARKMRANMEKMLGGR